MVLLNVELDNLLLFRNFSLNLSYPKKPVRSSIASEHLAGRPYFRYKKVVILMGANATGKTAIGKTLMAIFNFIAKKEANNIFQLIDNRLLPASFSVDLAFPDCTLYRISASVKARKNLNDEYSGEDLSVSVKHVNIGKTDNYQKCAERLLSAEEIKTEYYVKTLETVPSLSWLFEYSFASEGKQHAVRPVNQHLYSRVLKQTLQAMDPRIKDVTEIPSVENTYAIIYPNNTVLIKDGLLTDPTKLSSGTNEGIGVAHLISSMKINAYDFYFCDEKFSHIHTDIEKAFLSVMTDLIGDNHQLLFTTHNLDILEMNLPFHSFMFLRRDDSPDHQISCVSASDFLQKNNVSLRNAVENDLFSTAPSTMDILRFVDK